MENPTDTEETRPYPKTIAAPERWQQIKDLINAALELAVGDREKFLRQTCGEDHELRREVERLLASYPGGDSFLEAPAARIPALAAAMPQASDTLHRTFVAGTILASRYRIIGLLGKGGMGEVYKAEDIKLGQMVALKFLPDRMERDKDALARFHNEAKVARQVAHPNVCRVFDIGEIDGRHFLSMEFINGDDLSSLLRRIDRFSYERAIEISRQLCIGLAAIHNQGILHRDFKPANVIVDGNGKARITDFGIAGLAEEIARESVRAGTPAYMSPEQITGKGVSVRSDIYSLGLVLYEIFTGKQAFTGHSLPDLLRKQQMETPTTPSELVKGFDPLVEQVIFQCLEKSPQHRPASALHVAMALPGGNPLQVALEAGQTPSPEMVAATPKKGALKPAIALACLLGGIAMLIFCMAASMKVAPQNLIPFAKSAEVLSARANEVVARLGYTDAPAERWHRFYLDTAYVNEVRQHPSPENWEKISSGQPLVFTFIERHSPQKFDIWLAGNGFWLFEPQTKGGMRTISLDTRGRLVEFSAAPAQYTGTSATQLIADFAPAFSAAELDPAKFNEAPPNWTPPHACDARRAWEGVMPDHPEIPLRIEAASFQGRIVYFQLIYPWTRPNVTEFDQMTTRDWAGVFLLAVLLGGTLIAAIFLARRNLRSGSADRNGAFRTALVVFGLIFFGWLFSMSHTPSFFPELNRISHAIRIALYIAAGTWLAYLALEPIVRRNFSDLIVSWNRLLVGDWQDPLVGRDALLGALWGIGHLVLIYASLLAERFFRNSHNLFLEPNSLIGLRSSMSMVFVSVGSGIVSGFMIICFLVILFLLLRRRSYAVLILFLAMTTLEMLLFTPSLIGAPFTLISSALSCLVISRLGLVATIVSQGVFVWLLTTLFTLDFSAWYATEMFVNLFLAAALLGYGVKVSLAGQSLFGPAPLAE